MAFRGAFESGEDTVGMGGGGGGGLGSREPWAPWRTSDSPPRGPRVPEPPGPAFQLGELPYSPRAVPRSGSPKSTRLLCIFITHLVRQFFSKSLWVKGWSWEGVLGKPHCPLRLWGRPLRPLWAYLAGRSGFAPGFFSASSLWAV